MGLKNESNLIHKPLGPPYIWAQIDVFNINNLLQNEINEFELANQYNTTCGKPNMDFKLFDPEKSTFSIDVGQLTHKVRQNQ